MYQQRNGSVWFSKKAIVSSYSNLSPNFTSLLQCLTYRLSSNFASINKRI